jgi:hypothetical protein
MSYEAVGPERPACLYVHHNLEFPGNLAYLEELKEHGFAITALAPFLGYFELMDRGIGFPTLKDPWCVPLLIGTALIEWLRDQGAQGPREGVMFRGMSGSEYSRKFHTALELYRRLDLPCFNPLLGFSKREVGSARVRSLAPPESTERVGRRETTPPRRQSFLPRPQPAMDCDQAPSPC